MSGCTRPITAYAGRKGGPLLFSRPPGHSGRTVQVPCGKCLNCRLADCAMWGFRLMCEARMWEFSGFLTFTQDDEHCDPWSSVSKREVQLLNKRARERGLWGRSWNVGEYGTTTGRAHYHIGAFNLRASDWRPLMKNERGDQLFESPELTALWGRGHVACAELAPGNARYLASHGIRSKCFRERSSDDWVVPETGEVIVRTPAFRTMSNRPGIGALYLDRYGQELLDHGVYRGRDGAKSPIPAYFLDVLERRGPEVAARVAELRAERLEFQFSERARWERRPFQCGVRDKITRARLSIARRGTRAGVV